MISFIYIVFGMFRTTKCSPSGRLVHVVLWYMLCPHPLNCLYWCIKHTMKLHVQFFLRMKNSLFRNVSKNTIVLNH